MTKCPHCGSTAQVRLWDEDYSHEREYEIFLIRKYECGCGAHFEGVTVFCQHGDEEIEEEE